MSYAQDTARVMVYNILYYGTNAFGCSNSAPAMAIKDAALKKILKSTNPDIFVVNEMANNVLYAERILQNVLNTDGVSKYSRGAYTNTANSSIVNMMFYNNEKFGLHSEEVVNNVLRDINLSKLYYKDSLLGIEGIDTVFLTVINGHLKAGSSTSDRAERAVMIQNVLNNLSAKGKKDNYLIMGDFNARSSSEDAIQNLLNPADPNLKFLDPISSLGNWYNNGNFAGIHTQSTHTSGSCFAGGGMDDRFDLIFASEYIMGDSAKVKYIQGSYTAFGQDGNRFNGNINDGTNAAVPDSIADALYDASDHLPVFLDVEIQKAQLSGTNSKSLTFPVKLLNNPINEFLKVSLDDQREYHFTIQNLQGKVISKHEVQFKKSFEYNLIAPKGIYILHWVNNNGESSSLKILKK